MQSNHFLFYQKIVLFDYNHKIFLNHNLIINTTHKTTVSTKDIVIMATDGVIDAFETQENFQEFVSHLASNNPQTLAETILNEALSLNKMEAKDDMTVLVARTYLKN